MSPSLGLVAGNRMLALGAPVLAQKQVILKRQSDPVRNGRSDGRGLFHEV